MTEAENEVENNVVLIVEPGGKREVKDMSDEGKNADNGPDSEDNDPCRRSSFGRRRRVEMEETDHSEVQCSQNG